MELVVDLSTASVELRNHDDVKRFSVQARPQLAGTGDEDGALGALAGALSVHDVGTVDPTGEVFVSAEAVRRLANDAANRDGEPLSPQWGSNFSAMLDFAATKGWIAEDGSIRAHVEWGT